MSAPFLLTMADYYGTLAAVRCMGRAGVPVTVGEGKLLAPARWSRYATQRVPCPPVQNTEAFLDWLVDFGRRQPGHVLYPTSDDMAWLFALRADELRPYFKLYAPGEDVIYGLLNKKRLFHLCKEVGIETPVTVFPESEADCEKLAGELKFPLLIKPQTQILFENKIKGAQVETAAELTERYTEFVRKNRYGDVLMKHDPLVKQPMLQAFHAEAAENIYSLAGFIDESGDHFAIRGARKVLQRPRKLGVGLCFEHADVSPELAEKVRSLCKRIGYYGVFEVEFIEAAGKHLLIDFNPRFYGQMNFEIARNLPLPLLVHHAATGNREALARDVAFANAWAPRGLPVYCHRFIFEVLLRAQGMSGKLTPAEVEHWREWYRANEPEATDAVLDGSDVVPALVDAGLLLYGYARHPRAFLRFMVLDR